MKKLIKMTSIKQFRNIIKDVQYIARFKGRDENDKPIYDNNIKMPIIKVKGTTKLHGTNGSCCYNEIDGVWAQSKNNIITEENDNAGFAWFVNRNRTAFIELFEKIKKEFKIDTNKNTIVIYCEWAGKGIQKGVGISEIEKTAFIFGIKISPFNEEENSYWLDSKNITIKHNNIYNIEQFKTFELEIDFNEPLLSQNKMVEMVKEVENECPVAKHFGISGIGEGIVFHFKYKDNRFLFKMKGDKHAGKSKVKKAKKVDNEKLQKIIDTVEKITPEWRLLQMYNETFDIINGGTGDIKRTGDYIRAVMADIRKEESDIIEEAGLIPKDLNKRISDKVRKWLMIKLDEEAGLK